jgi:protein-L-isoaspartate(D-aspartate) O-methyltransferase
VPSPLCQQLTDGGRLIGPVGSRYDQVLVRMQRRGDDFEREMLLHVIFVLLTGKYGWKDY